MVCNLGLYDHMFTACPTPMVHWLIGGGFTGVVSIFFGRCGAPEPDFLISAVSWKHWR